MQTRRCATCQAVEAVYQKKTLKKILWYKKFLSSRSTGKKTVIIRYLKKYKIHGQTLLIVKGDKVTKPY